MMVPDLKHHNPMVYTGIPHGTRIPNNRIQVLKLSKDSCDLNLSGCFSLTPKHASICMAHTQSGIEMWTDEASFIGIEQGRLDVLSKFN